MHRVHYLFCVMEIFGWGRWNFELVQMFRKKHIGDFLVRTHGVHCVFALVLANSCLKQMEFWACAIFLKICLEIVMFRTLGVQSVYVEFLLGASAILSLCKCFFKIRLEIVLLRTHGVHCVFSFVLENSCLRQLKFWACAIILEKLNLRLFCYARMVCTVGFWLRWKFGIHAVGILSLFK